MPDASPAKWHLAHTSWFFDRFLIGNTERDRLYNSYYDSVGERVDRARRGTISRPGVGEVRDYRRTVTEAVLERAREWDPARLRALELGIHHEEQHQELLLTDIQHAFFSNPLGPAYDPSWTSGFPEALEGNRLIEIPEGVYEVGACPEGPRFAFDNETSRHRVFLDSFLIHSRPVLAGELLEFVLDGGYDNPLLWLSEGWARRKEQDWRAPLYWRFRDGEWEEFTLAGWGRLRKNAPATCISFYEADAFARWKKARLPTELEWEVAHSIGLIAPRGVWEWTGSAYRPYPGYRAFDAGFAEYNGKFMINQMVLRGWSWATPQAGRRGTYRNFFAPDARWQYSGFRLAG